MLEHLQRAILLAGNGKLAEAQAHCAKALLHSPNHFGVLHLSGVIACQLGQSQRGIELLNKAIGINPNVAEVHNDRGMALRGLRRWDEALASFDKAIALRPDYAVAHNNRGLTLHNLERLDDALACFDRTIKLWKDYADAHNNRGRVLQDLERFNEAIDSFDKAIQLNPDLADAHNHRGNALSQIKQLDEALASYDKAIELRPNFAEAYSNRGLTLKNLNQLAEAIGSYDRAIQLKPDFAQAYFNRANVLHKTKRFDEAIASYDKAIQLKPTFAEAYNNRGTILSELGRPKEAIASYDMAIQLKGDLAGSYSNRGAAFYELKRLNDALADFDTVIRLRKDQESAQAYCNRGNVLHKMGRLDEAIADYNKAIELNPNECSFYLSKFWTFERLKEPGLALDILREAERRFGDNEEVRFNLSRLADDPTPTSAPASHVLRLFDGYADTFESHLVERLQYKAPELIASCFLKHAPPRALDILDLGCGTGLMGSLLATRKRTMVGVDLTAKMIAKAKEKGIYDELHVAEIVAFLTTSFSWVDVGLAADALIYLGDLSPGLPAVRRVLVPSGLFAFSAERCAEGEYVLGESGRFSHSQDYIQRLATTTGFETLLTENAILRHQEGSAVEGFIAVLRSPQRLTGDDRQSN